MMQTELKYDLALIRLEFRYDDEVDWTLHELKTVIIIDELKKLDIDILQVTQKIEFCSFQISNL